MVEKFNPTSDFPKLDRTNEALGPGGGEDLDVEEVGQEVELDQPKTESNVELVQDGSAVINPEEPQIQATFNSNLAEFLDESYLQALANDLNEKVDNDKATREDWEQ